MNTPVFIWCLIWYFDVNKLIRFMMSLEISNNWFIVTKLFFFSLSNCLASGNPRDVFFAIWLHILLKKHKLSLLSNMAWCVCSSSVIAKHGYWNSSSFEETFFWPLNGLIGTLQQAKHQWYIDNNSIGNGLICNLSLKQRKLC